MRGAAVSDAALERLDQPAQHALAEALHTNDRRFGGRRNLGQTPLDCKLESATGTLISTRMSTASAELSAPSAWHWGQGPQVAGPAGPACKPKPAYMRRRRPHRPVPAAGVAVHLQPLSVVRPISGRVGVVCQRRRVRHHRSQLGEGVVRRRAGAVDGPIDPGLDVLAEGERTIDA